MGKMREEGGYKDWSKWNNLKNQLDTIYKEEEIYWQQKSRVQWLKDEENATG